MGMLEDKVILITGGGSGIGAATAEICAREGARLAVADFNETNGQKVADSINVGGGNAIFVRSDVSQEADVEAMVAETIRSLGSLDGAFNNAGIGGSLDGLTEMSADNWERVLAVNLTGVWLCMKHEIPRMTEAGGGSIVNTASIAGLVGTQLSIAYSASKFGVVGMTRSAAKGYGLQGVRVNAVCPGVIETPLATEQSPLFDDPELREVVTARHALGRYGQPGEVGEMVAWLLSDAASFVSGAAMPVDAGYVA